MGFLNNFVHLVAYEEEVLPEQEVLQHGLHRGHVLRGVVEERLGDLGHGLRSRVQRRSRRPQVELPVRHAANNVGCRILFSIESIPQLEL